MLDRTQITRIAFGPLDRILIGTAEYRCTASGDAGHVLVRANGADVPLPETFSDADIAALIDDDKLSHVPNFYETARALSRIKNGALNLFDLPEAEQRKILGRAEYVELLLAAERDDPEFKRTDDHLKKALKSIAATLAERNQARASQGKTQRCDQTFEAAKTPSPRTARRWMKMFEDGGHEAVALRDGHHRSGNPFSSLHEEALPILHEHVEKFLDRRRPSVKAVHEAMATQINELNAKRPAGTTPIRIPCKSTLRNAIAQIPAFDIHAGRYGIDAAKKKFAVVGRGLESVRPFQRVLMDGHKAQIMTLDVETEVFLTLSLEARKKLERVRLVMHLALDVATRCVVGVRFARSENTETARETLRMAVSDKTAYAAAAGCTSDWPMAARPGTIETDSGAAWISNEFRGCAANLRSSVMIAPVGRPEMRAHAERFFGTFDRQLLPNFSGRTFGSIAEKGEDDPAEFASLLAEELMPATVRYVVDQYHHQQHGGLLGMTPYAAWTELTGKYGILARPRSDELRNVFGVKLTRKLDHRGIRVAGVAYQSSKLQEFRRRVGDLIAIDVMFDPDPLGDIGAVSAFVDGAWLTVPALLAETFKGVCLPDWIEAARDLRRRNMISAEVGRHHVEGALRDLAAMGRSSAKRAGIITTTTADEIERAEREVLYGFDVVDGSENTAAPGGTGFVNAIEISGPSAGRRIAGEGLHVPPEKPVASARRKPVIED